MYKFCWSFWPNIQDQSIHWTTKPIACLDDEWFVFDFKFRYITKTVAGIPSFSFQILYFVLNICQILAQRTNLSSNFFLTSSSYRSKLLQLRKQIFWCLQLSFDVPPNFSSFLRVPLNLSMPSCQQLWLWLILSLIPRTTKNLDS